MQKEAYQGIWIFTEQRDGELLDVGLELLSEGRKMADKLGQELAAVLLGHQVNTFVDELSAYGADKVYLADDPVLDVYRNDSYSLVLEALIKEHKPGILLMGGTSMGMDLAPRVAAKVNTGLSAHCVGLDVDEEGCLKAHVPAFGGNVMASIMCARHRPQMATISPGYMKKTERKTTGKAIVENVKVEISEKNVRTKVVEVFREEPQTRPITSAETVIAGGFGIGKQENWKMLEELSAALGGAGIGATRPACDEGWAVLEEQMIGQSGKTVQPNLYIGVGISGVIHHLIGIKKAKIIVAINNDPKAPILKAADYAIIADFREILPVLIEELKKLKNK